MKRAHVIIVLLLPLTAILHSCGAGGPSSNVGTPFIAAELISFPTGSVPPGLFPSGFNSRADVYVIDDNSGVPITSADVSMNGKKLQYNAANQDYEGSLTVAPGESVSLRVTVGGKIYTASSSQFSSYPTITLPIPGDSWQTGYESTVMWFGGSPTTTAYYSTGVLDATDPNGPLVWPLSDFLDTFNLSTTSYSIPANNLSVGNRHVIVGIELNTIIADASPGSSLYIAGFNYVPITVTNATLVSIEVTPSNPSIPKGMMQQFAAIGTFSDSSVRDLTNQVTWTPTSSTAWNFVDSQYPGLAHGNFVDTTTITATFGNISGSTSLTVTPAELVSISVSPANNSIPCGSATQFSAVGTYSDGIPRDVTNSVIWNSSDTSVAIISNDAGSNGKVAFVSGGTTTISATSGDIVCSTGMTVIPLASLAVTPANPTVAIGATKQFTATGLYSNGASLDMTTLVTWSSSSTGIAAISTSGSNGIATAANNGSTTITASLCAVSGSTTLTVPTWTVRHTAASDLQSVAWSGSKFVAVGSAVNPLPMYSILTSPDGLTWTPQTTIPYDANWLTDIVWSGSQFVAVGDNSTMPIYHIFTSPDGVTWTGQAGGGHLYGIAWSGTQFAAVGSMNAIITSPDGISWTGRTLTTKLTYGQNYQSIVWAGTQFVGVGSWGTSITSPDGVAWTQHTSDTSSYLYGVAWSGTKFVAVGENGTIMTSFDGATWNLQSSGITKRLDNVVWSGTRFVAVGEKGTIITSPDGVSWEPWVSGVEIDLHGITWSGSEYVVVGKSMILTSQ